MRTRESVRKQTGRGGGPQEGAGGRESGERAKHGVLSRGGVLRSGHTRVRIVASQAPWDHCACTEGTDIKEQRMPSFTFLNYR